MLIPPFVFPQKYDCSLNGLTQLIIPSIVVVFIHLSISTSHTNAELLYATHILFILNVVNYTFVIN